MTFLEIDTTIKLQDIITRHPLIENDQARSIVLRTCGVDTLLAYDDISGGASLCSMLLVAHLQDPELKTPQGKHPLVVLLYYLSQTHSGHFMEEDIRFLQHVIALYPKPHASALRQQSLRAAFARERAQSESPVALQPVKRNWHDEIITEYDLDRAMGEFRAPLVHGKALAFKLSGDRDILKHYILRRTELEFKMKLHGDCLPDEIHLHQADLTSQGFSLSTLIAEKIKRKYAYAHEKDLVLKHAKQHILLTVWNDDLPGEMLREAVLCFWNTWHPSITSYLQHKSLCFALLLADVSPQKEPYAIDGFTSLPLPTSFDVQEHVLPWVDGKLQTFLVSTSDRKHCRAMLNDPHAPMWQTLHALKNIADYLQGTCNPERYHEHDSHHTRGRLR